MFKLETYKARRAELRARIGNGLIVLLGTSESPRNYFSNAFNYRQDSTFLYYFGLNIPDLIGTLDADSGVDTLYGNDFTIDDIIWMGPQPSVKELAASVGVSTTAPLAKVGEQVAAAQKAGRRVHFLFPYREKNVLELSEMTGISAAKLLDNMSVDLIIAVADMREVKSAEEIEEMERAFEIGYKMHTTAMKMTRAGVTEREVAGAIEGVSLQYGAGVSFHSIVSQHGETLHNHSHDGVLQDGRLLLVDAGGETVNNYCSDHTRTYPVSGKFTDRQRDIYNIVLAAHDKVAEVAAPGMYQQLHDMAYLVMAEGLRAQGLIKCSAEDAVAAGVMQLFMPHGLGHGLGMDVHDCEAMGERGLPDFSAVAARAAEFDTCIMRKNWRLRPGSIITDEPGIYFIPAYAAKWKNEGICKGLIDFDKLATYDDFGGIRIEDDILITENGSVMMGRGKHIPTSVEDIEAFMAR